MADRPPRGIATTGRTSPTRVPTRPGITRTPISARCCKAGLLEENGDGETLPWARHRLLAPTETQRILLMILDGAPADEAAAGASGANNLERHLC